MVGEKCFGGVEGILGAIAHAYAGQAGGGDGVVELFATDAEDAFEFLLGYIAVLLRCFGGFELANDGDAQCRQVSYGAGCFGGFAEGYQKTMVKGGGHAKVLIDFCSEALSDC